ncbi:hypothetical protein LguiA_025702 [Lonicera macranthoides]
MCKSHDLVRGINIKKLTIFSLSPSSLITAATLPPSCPETTAHFNSVCMHIIIHIYIYTHRVAM